MKTLQQFIQQKFDGLSTYLQTLYGNAANYGPSYISNRGMAPYLETLRGQQLSLEATEELAFAYLVHASRYPEEIHQILAGIARQYSVELPLIEGILTRDYWVDHAKKAGWPSATTAQQAAA